MIMTTSPTAIETGSFTDQNIKYDYSENELTINNTGKKVSFPYKIYTVLTYQDILIVLIDVPPKTIYNRGIFGVNMNGDIIWQVEDLKSPIIYSTFISIKLEDGKLMGWNWNSNMYYIDPMTGRILYKEFRK